MTGSRFDWRPELTLERLKAFVAIETITAQTPLLEVSRNGWPVRLWTAYDTTRTLGSFVEVWADGLVRSVTVYPSGRRHEIVIRPADKHKRVRRTKKQDAVKARPKRVQKVRKRVQSALST